MTATAEPPVSAVEARPASKAQKRPRLARGEGVELLGDIHGCGYRDGACLIRRGDGQMVQVGRLMYSLLAHIDGERDTQTLAAVLSDSLERQVDEEHVLRLAQKLARQGLLSGTEDQAPPRRHPLLALRWKVLITNPTVTRRLTAPFTFLFRPWLMWPIVACFAAVFWFVLIHKGVASATAEAFNRPGLLLLVFVLGVASAAFHELGHASAARYGGATPGGMGMGLYLVWPAFYTDVTDAYRLPKRDRLRVDLAGLYFNAVVAVLTMAVWLAVRSDALLLLVALQVLQMVKQLSPVIRADGYHILSDATGVPDLFAHLVPTLRRLLPGQRREPSALTGRARLLVTAWVLIVVPVLLGLMLGAVLLLPRLATTAWDSSRHIAQALPQQASHGQVIDVLASTVSLLALALPVAGSLLVTQKVVRTSVAKALTWSRGRPLRRVLVLLVGAAVAIGIAFAWWPSGQYQPIRPNQSGTLGGLVSLDSSPVAAARPASLQLPLGLTPGTHLAVAMIPVHGASPAHPAVFIVSTGQHKPVVVLSPSASKPPSTIDRPVGGGTATATTNVPVAAPGTAGGGTSAVAPTTTSTTPTSSAASSPAPATAFPFSLPAAPGPGGTQALAVGTKDGGVTYVVAYTLLTVSGGAPVTNTNGAYALADCHACTTVAVSFQVILVVGRSSAIAPIDAAGALNYNCPACMTTAIADQIVATLKSQPSVQLVGELNADLKQLNQLPSLGASGTPAAVAAQVADVQQEIQAELAASGLLANPPAANSATSTPTAGSSTTGGPTTTSTSPTPTPTPGGSGNSSGQTSSSASQTTTPTTQATTPSTTTSATPPPSTSSTPTTTSTTQSSSSGTGTTTTAPSG